jgi:signal transduction histidine kinase
LARTRARQDRTATALPDLILLDWVMPGLSGDEVCRQLRATPRTRDVPIVMLTAARSGTSDIVCALESGANDYVAKPFVPEELRARVATILRADHLRRLAELERGRITAVNRLGGALFRARSDVDTILAAVAETLVGPLCDGCKVVMLEESKAPRTETRHRSTDAQQLLARIEMPQPTVATFERGDAAATDARPPSFAEYARTHGLCGLIVQAVPIRWNATAMAMLTRDVSGPFDAFDVATIVTCLEYAGLAIEVALHSESDRATTRFHEDMIGIVGHDLRSPLSAMSLGLQMLRDRMTDPTSERVISRLDSSARRMTGIVEQLLDVTRARIGHGIPINPEPTNLYALVGGVVDELRLADAAATFELVGTDVHGEWDRARLEQVVSNVASNATKYGRLGVRVRLTVSQS